MAKDLTNSIIDRKNILNNNFAIQEVYRQIGFLGILYDEKYRFTKQQVADYFEVDTRTIDRIIEQKKIEISESGYEVFTGNRLKDFKGSIMNFIEKFNQTSNSKTQGNNALDGNDMNVVTMT